MAIQQRLTDVTDKVQVYGKITDGNSAVVDSAGVSLPLTDTGIVDHSLGMVKLVRGVPLEVTPAVDAALVQNTMPGRSQLLYVSTHGQMHGAWMSVPGQSCIEFDKMVYFMQKDYDEYVFPIASK